MTKLAIGYYGDNDYRLVKYDGADTVELATYDHKPTVSDLAGGVSEHHGNPSDFLPTSSARSDFAYVVGDNLPTVDKTNNHPWPWE